MTVADFNDVHKLYKDYSLAAPDTERVARHLTSLPSAVALDNGRIIAFAYCFGFAPDIVELANIFVSKDYRDKKVGTRLLSHLEQRLEPPYRCIIAVNSLLHRTKETKRQPLSFYSSNNYRVIYQGEHTCLFLKEV